MSAAVASLGSAQAVVGKGQNQFNYAVNLAQNQLGAATAACLLAGGCAPLAGLVDLGDNRLKPDERARLRGLRAGVWA